MPESYLWQMPVEIGLKPLPYTLQIFPFLLLVIFLWQRKSNPWWFYLIPFFISLALLGPYVSLKKNLKPKAIRLDTSYSFSLVERGLLKDKIKEIYKKYGILPIFDFWGNPIDIEGKLNYTEFHTPMPLAEEILISDVYADEKLFALKLDAQEVERAILWAVIPYICYKGDSCEIEVGIKSNPKENLFLFLGEKKYKLSLAKKDTKKNTFRFLVDKDFPIGPLYGEIVLGDGKTPLEIYPFFIYISEALPKGALVFDAPSFMSWQIARRLTNFPHVKIQAFSLENFRFSNFHFVIDLTGKLENPKVAILSLKSYLAKWENYYAQDLFKENRELDELLSSFLSKVRSKPPLFKGTALAVETPFCAKESVDIFFQDQKIIPQKKEENFCYFFPQSGHYTFHFGKEIRGYVGISLAERSSLEKKGYKENSEDLYWQSWQKEKREEVLFLGFSSSEENIPRVIFLACLFLLIFVSWFIRL